MEIQFRDGTTRGFTHSELFFSHSCFGQLPAIYLLSGLPFQYRFFLLLGLMALLNFFPLPLGDGAEEMVDEGEVDNQHLEACLRHR